MENMNGIKVFENSEFGQVRVIERDGEPWFVGKDVAEVLGYSNPRKAIIDHVDDEDKQDGVTIRDAIGREQTPVVINESGLYSLVISSKLPSAKQFKRWITHDVIPSIRKHGGYIAGQEQMSDLELLARSVLLSQSIIKEREKTIEQQQEQIKSLEQENDILANGIRTWGNRPILNALVRAYASAASVSYADAWSTYYRELEYRYSIGLKKRKAKSGTKQPYIAFIEEGEWSDAIKCAAAMLRELCVDIVRVIGMVNAGKIKEPEENLHIAS